MKDKYLILIPSRNKSISGLSAKSLAFYEECFKFLNIPYYVYVLGILVNNQGKEKFI